MEIPKNLWRSFAKQRRFPLKQEQSLQVQKNLIVKIMIWNANDTNDSRVVSHAYWRQLNNYGDLEARSGVYIFADVNKQVKYIGKAGARRMVLEIESALNRRKGYGATQVKALYTNSDANALSLERDLINKYNPPNNLV
ncbi:MAG: hypothetical protein ACOYXB_15960 [Bacteroidota bacterium]